MEQLSVFLVDDESLILESLQVMIDWEGCGCRLAGAFLSGREALEQFGLLRPQILILDINIPDMSGLELAREILARDNAVQILLLTSHRSFEYARDAVQLGVFSYLLKHDMDPASLREALWEARAQYLAAVRRSAAALRTALQSFLYHGDCTEDPLLFPPGASHALLLVRRAVPFSLTPPQPDGFCLADFLMRSAQNTGTDLTAVEAADVSGYAAAVLVRLRHISQSAALRALHELAASLSAAIAAQFQEKAHVIISPVHSPPGALYGAGRELCALGEYTVFLERRTVVFLEELRACLAPADCPASLPDPEEIYRMVCSAPAGEDIPPLIEGLFRSAFQAGWSIQTLHSLCYSLFLVIGRCRIHSGLPVPDAPQSFGQEARLRTVSQVQGWFAGELKSLHRLLLHSCSPKVRDSILELRRRHAGPVTVQEVAAKAGISEIYLRTLLKRETGMTFTEHLTLFRIEMAKLILSHEDCRIYEVAGRVGYQDVSYFSQLFKKTTGQYPFEYRKRCEG